ncbi:hypothetical protein ACQ4PT_045978 [Festuca glaucescens]
MAGKAQAPSRGAAPPPNFTLRWPIIPRLTPGRVEPGVAGKGTSVGGNVDAGMTVATNAAAGATDSRAARNVPATQMQPSFQSSRFEAGGSSAQAGRFDDRRRDDFADQDYGEFQQGFYEGNNGYGNGYGSHARGNFRQRPYNNYMQQWSRNFNNNYRGSGRFNNSNNRYQRRFNNNENLQVETTSQKVETTQLVASASGEIATSASSQQMDTSSLENLVQPLSSRAQNKIDKMHCLKCGEFGHFADACTAVLCLYCENISHESKNCPLLSMPKPVAITYGVCQNELIFHEVPTSSEVTFKHDSGKVGKISVTGGSLTALDIINELQWIILGNHQWDLKPTDDGAFKVLFPSKADLARMTKIINVPVPGTNMFLLFEEWSAADLDKFDLSSVWVRVHGCYYKERCDYLSLFGVGFIIGKTKEVDMAYTRAHSDVRMLVEVTRVEYIPTTTVDHTYAGQGYGLIFKLESNQSKDKSDVEMHEVTPDGDPKKEEGNGHEMAKDGNLNLGGDAKIAQTPKQVPPKQNLPSKQAGALSLPALRVGLIDCPRPKNEIVSSWSESKVPDARPRKLWGDCEDDEEDTLLSPLPRLHDLCYGDDVTAGGILEASPIAKRALFPDLEVCSAEMQTVSSAASLLLELVLEFFSEVVIR